MTNQAWLDLSYWITYGLSSVQNSLSWRIPLILQVCHFTGVFINLFTGFL